MNDRVFRMRLACQYSGTDNDVSGLEVDLLEEQSWKPFDLNSETAGFLVFVYSVFTCQHRHLRVGSAEYNLLLGSATGSIHLATNEDWRLTQIHIDFECKIRSGTPTADNINSISELMKNCPVSRNLKPDIDCETSISFKQA